jgi:hypothetical protein
MVHMYNFCQRYAYFFLQKLKQILFFWRLENNGLAIKIVQEIKKTTDISSHKWLWYRTPSPRPPQPHFYVGNHSGRSTLARFSR